MTLIFHNNQLLFVGGLLAKSTACCCTGTSTCACCTHLNDLCLVDHTLHVAFTGAVTGTGSMQNPDTTRCPFYIDTGITLLEECGDPGFQVTLELTCIGGTRCVQLVIGWVDAELPVCTMIPDTSRGAESDGFKSFKCNPLEIIYHYKTSGVGCACGDGTAVTITITE